MPTDEKPLTPEEELYREAPDEISDNDRDFGNIELRAGYVRTLANIAKRLEDRLWLLRASRSLRAYAELLRDQMNGTKRHRTISIEARCETLARGYLRRSLGAEQTDAVVSRLKETMLQAVAFAFQEFPELERGGK